MTHFSYFTLVNVRHPLARLYSAWHDKFRNKHPWMAVIRNKIGKYLDLLEQRDMSNEDYEYSFEAFVEVAALTPFNFQRDRHWFSMTGYCSP